MNVNMTEGDITNILSAIDIIVEDLRVQLADETQNNIHVLCEIKIKEYEKLRNSLSELIIE